MKGWRAVWGRLAGFGGERWGGGGRKAKEEGKKNKSGKDGKKEKMIGRRKERKDKVKIKGGKKSQVETGLIRFCLLLCCHAIPAKYSQSFFPSLIEWISKVCQFEV
jgi:hypothetical protein